MLWLCIDRINYTIHVSNFSDALFLKGCHWPALRVHIFKPYVRGCGTTWITSPPTHVEQGVCEHNQKVGESLSLTHTRLSEHEVTALQLASNVSILDVLAR